MVSCEQPSLEGAVRLGDERPRGLRGGFPGLIVGLSFVPMLVLFCLALWSRPHYQFFPLVAGFAVALAVRKCRDLGPLRPLTGSWSRWAAVLCWCFFGGAVALVSLTGGAVAFMTTLILAIATLGGAPLLRACLPSWCLLWLTIPPPRGLDQWLIDSLQTVVSRWSSECLDLAGVLHVMDGSVVEVAGRRLLVDQACSGIYSLLTLAIGTLCYGLWMRSSIVRTLILLAASVFWVLLGNVGRVVVVVALSTRYGLDVASGWPHELLGLVMFVVMLGLVVSTDRLLEFFASLWRWFRSLWHGRQERILREFGYAPIPADSENEEAVLAEPPRAVVSSEGPRPTILPNLRGTWLGSWLFAAAFGLLLIPQGYLPGVSWPDQFRSGRVFATAFDNIEATFLPEQIGPFRRAAFDTQTRDMSHSLGEFSRVWLYQGLDRSVLLSIDYEFADWHDLTLCYRNQGWIMSAVRIATPGGDVVQRESLGDFRDDPVVEAEFDDIEGLHGSLLFGLFDRKGKPLAPPTSRGFWHDLRVRLNDWGRRDAVQGRPIDRRCYQLQVFIEGAVPPTPSERIAIRGLFEEARKRLSAYVAASGAVNP